MVLRFTMVIKEVTVTRTAIRTLATRFIGYCFLMNTIQSSAKFGAVPLTIVNNLWKLQLITLALGLPQPSREQSAKRTNLPIDWDKIEIDTQT